MNPNQLVVPGFRPVGPRTIVQGAGEVTAGDYRSLPFLDAMRACTACPCRQEARQVVPGIGPVASPVLVIGQNPGEDEDRLGQPFLGAGGDELNQWFRVLGWDRSRLLITHAVKCHTIGNRLPKTSEQGTCVDLWLAQELAQLTAVTLLLPVGKPASTAILGRSAPPMTPLAVHHIRIRLYGRDLHVFPLPHPAFLLRARHLAPLFRETILSQLRLTLEQELPDVCARVKAATAGGVP